VFPLPHRFINSGFKMPVFSRLPDVQDFFLSASRCLFSDSTDIHNGFQGVYFLYRLGLACCSLWFAVIYSNVNRGFS
jgi:hypothetical protein